MRQIFLLLLSMPLLVSSQKLTIKVVSEDNKAIPYCSVTWNKHLGLVTDSMGEVGIPDILQADSIIIYALGFEQKILSRSDINNISSLIVTLKQSIIQLPEVIVWDASTFKEFGVTVKKEGYIYFKYSICTNFQLAVKVSGYSGPAKLNAVSVYISSASQDSVPFRFRIYDMNEQGFPGKDLITENVIVANYKKGHWNNIDLTEYNFGKLPANGFFISMEQLCNDLKENIGLSIAGTDEINSQLTFFKNGNANWTSFSSPSPNKRNRPTNFLIKATLGFPAK